MFRDDIEAMPGVRIRPAGVFLACEAGGRWSLTK